MRKFEKEKLKILVRHSYKLRVPLISWGLVYFLFWCYRCIYSVIGEVVVMRLTPVSDTRSYQAADFFTTFRNLLESGPGGTLGLQTIATDLTKTIGGGFGVLFLQNPIMINIGFQTIGFIGLLAMLRALQPRERTIILPILMLPSLTVWTSIASKEAILTFLVGIICAHIINMYTNTDRIRWYLILCFVLLYMYKPHYLVSLGFIIGTTYVARYFRQKATVAMIALICSFILLYIFSKEVSDLANFVDYALTSMGGDSVRPRLLVEDNDVFIQAPYGMFLSFFGPTLGEIKKVLHVVTFIESSLIVGVFLFLTFRDLPSLPIYNIILSFGAIFWIIFLNYPLGANNAGTAIRYRSGYILIVILAFVFLMPRSQYVNWIKGLQQRMARGRRPTVKLDHAKNQSEESIGTSP